MQSAREDIENARIFGAVGVALGFLATFLWLIPYIGGVLGVAAWLLALVLLVLAFYKLSKGYNRPGIFRNYVIHLVLYILASVSLVVLIVALIGAIIAMGILFARHGLLGGLGAIAIAAVFFFIFWFLLIAAYYFYYKSVSEVSEASRIELFAWSGIAALAGAATVVIFVGFLLILLAEILLLVGFLVLEPPQEPRQQATPEATVSL